MAPPKFWETHPAWEQYATLLLRVCKTQEDVVLALIKRFGDHSGFNRKQISRLAAKLRVTKK